MTTTEGSEGWGPRNVQGGEFFLQGRTELGHLQGIRLLNVIYSVHK